MRSVRGYADDCCSAANLHIETGFDTPRENQVGLAIFGAGEVDTTRRRIRYWAVRLRTFWIGANPNTHRVSLTFAPSSPVTFILPNLVYSGPGIAWVCAGHISTRTESSPRWPCAPVRVGRLFDTSLPLIHFVIGGLSAIDNECCLHYWSHR